MAITDAELAAIRGWVGSEPDDADLGVRWDRLGGVYSVSLEVLRGRLADAVERSALTVEGFLREDAPSAEALKTMRYRIGQLEGLVGEEAPDDEVGDTGGLGAGRFVRADQGTRTDGRRRRTFAR